MYSLKRKVFYFALISRVFVIILSAVSNFILPDHDAHVFISPSDPSDVTVSVCDVMIKQVLGGLVRWDGQYFLHIVLYGYTYENCLAFFPLFPILVRTLTTILYYPLQIILSKYSVALISYCFINMFCFLKAAVTLFELGTRVLHSEYLSYIAAVLFCVNPASIFFSAPYSESLFAYLTFFGMLKCGCGFNEKFNIASGIPFGLAGGTRSNGILNIGFIIFKNIRSLVNCTVQLLKAEGSSSKVSVIFRLILACFIFFIPLIYSIFLSIALFASFQVYAYHKFCIYHVHNLPEFIVEYAKFSNSILPGVKRSPWCDDAIPLSYSYVQSHYWGVGFLSYYQWKQIPNFLLVLPVVVIVLSQSFNFFREHYKMLPYLGILSNKSVERDNYFPQELFVYVTHILFLTIFCLLNIHVQVTTRMLCSASPALYWLAAYMLAPKEKNGNILDKEEKQQIESQKNLQSVWKVFIISQNSFHNIGYKFVKYYFLSYMVIGTIVFSNFYPWT